MIKVNLLRQSGGAKSNTRVGTFTNIQSPNFEGGNKGLLIRLGLVIVPVILGYFFGSYNIGTAKDKIKKLNQQAENFEKDIGSIKPDLDLIEKLNSEKNKLSQEISNLKLLSKKRYRLAKSLDAIQTLIPEKAWLVKISYKANKIIIEGRAPDDQIVSSFMENLEQSALFANVTWIDSKEVNEPQGIVKLFNIQFDLENI